MKRLSIIFVILLAALLTACASAGGDETGTTTPELKVTGGDISQSYTRADLEALGQTESAFKDVNYVGVTVADLLVDAGFDLDTITAVKAVAADGFTVNYEPSQVLAADVIVAYAQADGDLAEEDGSFRMVLPGAEGKLNPRMLVELQVIQ